MYNPKKSVFLRAEWRKLIMANYEVDAKILEPFLPLGVELDTYKGKHYVSLVGFLFLNTKVLGIPIPFHRNFEEFNLRFYVKSQSAEGWRRGVVFVKEIVPRLAISLTANILYREPYVCMPMKHEISIDPTNSQWNVSYEFKNKKSWNQIYVKADSNSKPLTEGSMEEFILEHYWGYNRYSPQKTMEYAVEHPPWEVYNVLDHSINIDYTPLYGSEFSPFLEKEPNTVFLAEGSEILVRRGKVLE